MKRQDKNIDEFRQSVADRVITIWHNNESFMKDDRWDGIREYLIKNISKIVDETVEVKTDDEHYHKGNKVTQHTLLLSQTWVEYDGETYTVSFKYEETYSVIAEHCPEDIDPWDILLSEAGRRISIALTMVCGEYYNNK